MRPRPVIGKIAHDLRQIRAYLRGVADAYVFGVAGIEHRLKPLRCRDSKRRCDGAAVHRWIDRAREAHSMPMSALLGRSWWVISATVRERCWQLWMPVCRAATDDRIGRIQFGHPVDCRRR
jgi:hypothetical protein